MADGADSGAEFGGAFDADSGEDPEEAVVARPDRIRIGPADLLGARALAPVSVGGRALVLVRDGGRLVAVERACPHEGADLVLGRCSGGRLVCPRHLASFDLDTGAVSAGWSFRGVRVFQVRAEAGDLWMIV